MRFYSKAFRIGMLSLTVSTLCACAVVTGKHETLAQVDNARLNLPEVSGRTLAQWPRQTRGGLQRQGARQERRHRRRYRQRQDEHEPL